jgi:hypothetical protein
VARTRAQRRRRNGLLALALVSTVLVLAFAEDISRSAHQSTMVRRSENRSFAALGNALIGRENQIDAHLGYLLTHGATLTRPVFAARLAQVADALPPLVTAAELLRRPPITGDLNVALAQTTESRVDDYQAIVDQVAASLSLPWRHRSSAPLDSVQAVTSLQALDRSWDARRRSLAHDPGLVSLAATTTSAGVVGLAAEVTSLARSSTLRVTRAVAISAVQVRPSPLPAAAGQILLPTVNSFHLGVSVTNLDWVDQPVTLSVTFVTSAGATQSQTMRAVLGPTRSFAFAARTLSVLPGGHGVLSVVLRGSGSTSLRVARTFHVVVSPAVSG